MNQQNFFEKDSLFNINEDSSDIYIYAEDSIPDWVKSDDVEYSHSYGLSLASFDTNDLYEMSISQITSKSIDNSSICEERSNASTNDENLAQVSSDIKFEDISAAVNNPNTDLNNLMNKLIFGELDDIELPTKLTMKTTLNKKMRKTPQQVKILTNAYNENNFWDSELTKELAAITGLKQEQVYKWYKSYQTKMFKKL